MSSTAAPAIEGKLYFCVVLDTFSRFVADWAINSTQTTKLVLNASGIAIRRRNGKDGPVIHSHPGVQFASWTFSRHVYAGLAPSMDRVGAPYDNAMSTRSGAAARSSS